MAGRRKPNQKRYKFKFSFVMPVYNVASYLAESVESIIHQHLDFEPNCEIIFIDDGSTDNSADICLKYKRLYPKNIKYTRQGNQGVGAARNKALKQVEGEFVSFLDSDDKISRDTLVRVDEFFKKHYDEVDFVAIKINFFEARIGPHHLNYKFNRTRVVDIEKEFNCVQLSGASSFIKSSALIGRTFDTHLRVSEDARLLTEIVLDKMAFGILAEPTYWYRKRYANDSAIDNDIQNFSWYTDTPKLAYKYLFDYSRAKLGMVPRYVQYLVMCDLQWRFKQKRQNVLSASELKAYKRTIVSLLKDIDDKVILAQRNIGVEEKMFILSKRYGRDIVPELDSKNGDYYFKDKKIFTYNDHPIAVIDLFELKGNTAIIEGHLRGYHLPKLKIGFLQNGKFREAEWIEARVYEKSFLGEVYASGNFYKLRVTIDPDDILVPALKLPDGGIVEIKLETSRMSRLPNNICGESYRVDGEYLIYRPTPARLLFSRSNWHNKLIRETRYLACSILRHKDFGIIVPRLSYFAVKPFFKKKLWLISDRLEAAGDNGEALFRYLSTQKLDNIKQIFAISKKSPDFKRVRAYGKVVNRDGYRYKLLFLLSDKLISSHADDFVVNAFGNGWASTNNLLHFDYVFLQHGIIHNNLSEWLIRYQKNIKLFVTSAKPEYDSIVNGDYCYGPDEVKLTGSPRYDLLDSNNEGLLVIAPTWRKQLTNSLNNPKLSLKNFKNSEYYRFYQRLLNDPRLIKSLESSNMKAEFYIHPALARLTQAFTSESDRLTIKKPPHDYKPAFERGDLLLTDYSSVAFDFAYLGKPVIYSQFDKRSFFNCHIYSEGYFEYDRDGFGPVTSDYGSTIRRLTKYLEDGAKAKKQYQQRAEAFFAFRDQRNSERVYKALLKMDKNSGT